MHPEQSQAALTKFKTHPKKSEIVLKKQISGYKIKTLLTQQNDSYETKIHPKKPQIILKSYKIFLTIKKQFL